MYNVPHFDLQNLVIQVLLSQKRICVQVQTSFIHMYVTFRVQNTQAEKDYFKFHQGCLNIIKFQFNPHRLLLAEISLIGETGKQISLPQKTSVTYLFPLDILSLCRLPQILIIDQAYSMAKKYKKEKGSFSPRGKFLNNIHDLRPISIADKLISPHFFQSSKTSIMKYLGVKRTVTKPSVFNISFRIGSLAMWTYFDQKTFGHLTI